ncbi:hypothetical protein [Microbacterium sp. OVT16B]|uniref:hypothetical protein n=1 Tax=Microbacterium sp. OVT16B TaxID=2862682 RepID=UPI000CFB347F|nr:hypothetical protein [Microbacterium sp. OVT16B]PRB09483.1 hypothetical protein CQ047_10570 [Microbacterium sp. MYb72]
MKAAQSGESFGIRPSRSLPETELAPIRARLARASKHARELDEAVQVWRANTVFTSSVRVSESTPTVLEVSVEASRAFPHDLWSTKAGEFAYQARVALDNLHDLLARSFAEREYDSSRIQFPITATGKDWKSWKQGHRFHPQWLVERLKNVQPQYGPYRALEGLQWFNNKDKHEWVRDLELGMIGMVASSNFSLRGLIEEHHLSPTLIPQSNTIPRGVRRVIVGSFDVGHPILDFPEEATNEVQVELRFDVGSDSYTLEEIREIPVRIGYIVDYLACDDLFALARYQKRPSYIQDAPADYPSSGTTEVSGGETLATGDFQRRKE